MNDTYQVLRFSPNPEEVEFINIAILVSSGQNHFIYDENFPRLTRIAPSFDKSLLTTQLEWWQVRLIDVSPESAAHTIRSASSQFQLTESRRLLVNIDQIESILRARYL